MKKFGRYEYKNAEPVEIYEGDRMELEGSHVKILNYSEIEVEGETVAVIRLDAGQTMREIKQPETETGSKKAKKARG